MLRFGSLQCAAIAAAMTGITVLAPAVAQQAGIVAFDLFTDDDSVELNPDEAKKLLDAVRKAQAPGDCPLGRITIITPEADPLFQEALGKSRRDAVLQFLDRQGIDVSRFYADAIMFDGNDLGNDAQLDYLGDDKTPPMLDTNWAPINGTPVKPGDQIKVTMVARDDPDPRPTGIKTIQLVADSEGGRFVASEDYEPCSEPRERRVEATYTVPANPPPIVRLTALAEDHAGLMDTDVGEFPRSVDGEHEDTADSEDTTGDGGDWYGRIDWLIPFPAGRMWGRLDLTFDYDGQGNLKGQMTGDDHVETQPRGEFCGMTTQTPSKLSAKLVGQYTPGRNTMSLQIADPQIEQGQYSLCAIGPDGRPLPMSGMPFGGGGPLGQPGLAELLNSLTVRSDGSVEASGEWPVTPASPVPTTLHMKLTLHRTQN